MDPSVPSPHLGHIDDPTLGMVSDRRCATEHAQRNGVKQTASPYTSLFYPHLRATELGMRVEPVWNMDGPDFALHSPWPHTRDDPRLGMMYNP